jgi:methylthioribose-1-phosphate isomerase
MKQTLFYYLQVGKVDDAAYRLIDYGPLGIYAFITTAGFVALVLVIRKKYERHLNEKNKEIHELKEEIRQLRDEVRNLTYTALKRLNDSLDHMNDVVSENSKSHYETAAVVNETKGAIRANSEKLIQILEKVLINR